MERQLAAIEDLCAQATDGQDLFEAVSDRVGKVVPFDGSCWFGMDPTTVLPSAPVRIENVGPGHCETFWIRESTVQDALLFRDLARAPRPAGTLYAATDSTPARSARYREFLEPEGYGDEIRAVCRTAGSAWGTISLFREKGRQPFGEPDLSFLTAVGPVLATALRSLSATAVSGSGGSDAPGTALFSGGVLASLDPQAEYWFAELAGPSWSAMEHSMTGVYAAVARAQAVAERRERGNAAVHLRAISGRWLAVQASVLRAFDGGPGPIAVTIGPAKSSQIAPIIIEAYCLTAREQEVTQAVARGLSNQEIAAALFLSAHTVRDHLKAVFAKVGVSSRGELVAKLFADHYADPLHLPGAYTHVEA